tara:strand:+ start:3714 stop:4052 length:339 start_codon:yes stop_codon:yes gene_type:complete
MKLNKRIYTTQESDKLIDRSFKELGNKTEGISITSFFNIYNNLFSEIPKGGFNSHADLVDRSSKYIGLNTNAALDRANKKIKELEDKISRLQSENETLKLENVEKDRILNTQ